MQVDCILLRQCNLKEIKDCNVEIGKSIPRQHWMVVCRMVVGKRKTAKAKQRLKRQKLKNEDCWEYFRKMLN